jgi:membrane-associated protein
MLAFCYSKRAATLRQEKQNYFRSSLKKAQYVSPLLPYLINWLQDFGYPVLWVVVFVAAIGVPLPISLVLLAAGAFASLGDFNIVLLLITALSALICGDNIGYWIGRSWGTQVLDWLQRSRLRRFVSPERVARSRAYFQRRGGWAIFLSRFLFSALGGVINLLAGTGPYPYRGFLLCDVSGEVLGAVIPLGLGYLFGVSWDAIGILLSGFSALLLGLLAVALLAYWLLKTLPKAKAATSRKRTREGNQPVKVVPTVVDQPATNPGYGDLLP